MAAASAHERLREIEAALLARFEAAGHQRIDTPILGPADPLFDLYGEEIRERAFIVEDIDQGDWCLRPDFTVPVARAHLSAGGGAARYAYAGPVFRRPGPDSVPAGPGLDAAQHLQAGVERIGDPDAPEADAAVFALVADALTAVGVDARETVTGDLGVAFGLIGALVPDGADRRRLLRHFWRPARLLALLAELRGPAPAARRRLVRALAGLTEADAAGAVAEMIALSETPQIGVRQTREAADRLLEQAADLSKPRPSAEALDVIDAALSVSAPAPEALTRLSDLARAAGADLSGPLTRFERRLEALAAADHDPAALRFEARYGHNIEYYDGFVFEFRAEISETAGARSVKLGGGGRYDRLFAALGEAGAGVGAALRPQAILAARAFQDQDGEAVR